MDIVDRLREHAKEPYHPDEDGALASEAADVIERIKKVVDRQAADDGCWFIPQTCAEDYLQRRLRELHAAIEGTDIYGCKSTK